MTVLNVPEMSCSHCVDRISKALTEENLSFEVSLEQKTVSINGSPADVTLAITVLEDAGYDVLIPDQTNLK